MHFALLGDHPDGLAMAQALIATGRHQVLSHSGPPTGFEYLKRWQAAAKSVADIEEILADPTIEAVIVASKLADRPAVLRRALQSEHHVICVHPADLSPDIAYEAGMLQEDTHKTLFPLLPAALHPAIRRMVQLLHSSPHQQQVIFAADVGRIAEPTDMSAPDEMLIQIEQSATESVLLEPDPVTNESALPGWEVLRLLGGEIVEVTGLAVEEEVHPDAPLLVSGRFAQGALFQMTLLPYQKEDHWHCSIRASMDRIDLVFPDGQSGPSRLNWIDETNTPREETWESYNPWPALVEAFETTVAGTHLAPRDELSATVEAIETTVAGAALKTISWQDETRCLELDDAARRSVQRRRASTLDFQEVSEEVGFKGTMTLVGCSILWASILLLIASVWLPWLGWFIAPIFGFFLLLQILRWVLPPKVETARQQPAANKLQKPPP